MAQSVKVTGTEVSKTVSWTAICTHGGLTAANDKLGREGCRRVLATSDYAHCLAEAVLHTKSYEHDTAVAVQEVTVHCIVTPLEKYNGK